jgi:hypothetical protein
VEEHNTELEHQSRQTDSPNDDLEHILDVFDAFRLCWICWDSFFLDPPRGTTPEGCLVPIRNSSTSPSSPRKSSEPSTVVRNFKPGNRNMWKENIHRVGQYGSL